MLEGLYFDKLIKKYPLAKKRTSKNKQFTIIYKDKVLKGPYKGVREKNITERSKILASIDDEITRTYFLRPSFTEVSFQGKKEKFAVFENKMKVIDTETYKESFSDFKYDIVTKSNIISIGTFVEEKPELFFSNDKLREDLLLAFCYLYCLNVGDIGLHNTICLPENGEFYIIDIDDSRTKDPDCNTFYFSKAPKGMIKWYERMKDKYSVVAESLKNLRLPDEFETRKQRCIELLLKYSNSSFGRMHWSGLFTSKSFSGLSLDVLKSALQKYVRRCVIDKALQAAYELYSFGSVGGEAAVTNLYNRLAIISAEDIGIANVGLIVSVLKLILSKNRNAEVLGAIVLALCKEKKTRIASHVHYYYVTSGLCLRDEEEEEEEEKEEFLPSDVAVKYLNDEQISFLESFVKCVIKKNLKAAHYAFKFFNSVENLKIPFVKITSSRKISKADIILLHELSKLNGLGSLNETFIESYFTFNEKRVFFYMMLLPCFYEVTDTYEYDLVRMGEYIKEDLQPFIKCEVELKVDDYVIDKHTAEGKRRGSNTKKFVTEGAKVENQDFRYYDERLAKIYEEREN